MDLYEKLLNVKHLRFDDEGVISVISDLQSNYRFELEGSLLMHFKCKYKNEYHRVSGFITNYKFIILIRVININRVDRIDQIVRSYSVRDHIDESMPNPIKLIDNEINNKDFCIGDMINICVEYANVYNYGLTFASILPQMTKRAM